MRNNSLESRKRILKAAEELFAEKGFNGTSVNMIAEKASVNKAMIYYHFKDKNDIIVSMFEEIIKEAPQQVNTGLSDNPETDDSFIEAKKESIGQEIRYMLNRKSILSVMLMESLKGDDKNNYFFKCAESVFQNELKIFRDKQELNGQAAEELQRELVYEFFTGFVPIITFSIFLDKWSEYYKIDRDKSMEYFLDSFGKTHLAGR